MVLLTATGEPAVCLAVAVPLAIRHAVASARADAGTSDLWYPIGKVFLNNGFGTLVLLCLQMDLQPWKMCF